jgi:hypothetical protein
MTKMLNCEVIMRLSETVKIKLSISLKRKITIFLEIVMTLRKKKIS